ncbi:MAG: protein tyrosine kinase [Woeseiaceae bacterium]|nr:protein tyrosine kinase [Woeseiaceae bacterium]
MSKIQKALQAMRAAEKDSSTVTREKAERFVASYGPNVAPRVNGGLRERKRRSTDTTITPVLPEDFKDRPVANTVEIDRDKLAESGFWPTGPDEEVIAEQFRRAKRPVISLAFETGVPTGENANVVMMASAMPGAGKSFCSVNLARSIARERDIGAVLVDADVLRSGISRSLGLGDRPGLMDYLLDENLTIEDILLQTDLDGIIVVPAGQRHSEATELLSSRRMTQFVNELSARFRNRVILCDTPPILVTNEAHVFAAHVGQIVLVIEARYSTQESVLQALASLDRDKPINAILNKSRTARGSGYYGDDYGYYPFHGDKGDDAEKAH